MEQKHALYMNLALDLAKKAAEAGEVPVGCVVVQNGQVIGQGRNRRKETHSTLAHAEIEAIHMACETLQDWRLDDCELYVTLEPCPMCAGAILNARISRVWYGARDSTFGACGGVMNLFMEPFPNSTALVGGILSDACQKVLTDFFQNLRDQPETQLKNLPDIYLDNAATTQTKPSGVAEAVITAMKSCGNSGRGSHRNALSASRTVYHVREQLAELFHCPRPDYIAFTQNATQALNTVISGLFDPQEGDHIISTDWEHNSVLRPLERFQRQGGAVDFLPADQDGHLDYDSLEKFLRPQTRALICTHASNLTGDLLDLNQIGNFAQAHDLLLILDVSQTAGSFPIDMVSQHIDIICFTGHKGLLGPQGTGGICLRENLDIRPFLVGGTGVQSFLKTQPAEYPTRLEAGTLNSHGLAGLSAALDFLQSTGLDAIHAHEFELVQDFCRTIRELPNVQIYGDVSAKKHAPIISLNIGTLDSTEVSDELAERFGIAVRPGIHCAPRLHRALGTSGQGAVRFSWSYFNTADETKAAAAAIQILSREAFEIS